MNIDNGIRHKVTNAMLQQNIPTHLHLITLRLFARALGTFLYHKIHKANLAKETFRERFLDKNPPAKSTRQSTVEKNHQERTSLNLNEG